MNGKIIVAGLGAGDLNQLPLGIYKLLKQAKHIFLRTKEHPVVQELEKEGFTYTSFDAIYEKHDQFDSVYEEIVTELFKEAETHEVLYCVPGHPLVAEKTVELLLAGQKQKGIQVEIKGGQSFLDAMFQAIQVDPIDGFQLLDAATLQGDEIDLRKHQIIGQVYDVFVASHVKLTLLELLPHDYRVQVVAYAGMEKEEVRTVPLFELDHEPIFHNLTSLYVPPVQNEELLYNQFATFKRIIAALRGPGGCPWDQKQTHITLKPYLIEEAYELLDAIDEEDVDGMIEELGDVLLQVLLHAQIGEDEGHFTIRDVIASISSKMVRRHPHVFGEKNVKSVDEVISNWQDIKAGEKNQEERETSILNRIEKSLPSLLKAYELQKEAGKAGFDWEEAGPALEKVKEEIAEIETELNAPQIDRSKLAKEIGDLLFASINVARLSKIHPEDALRMTNEKFIKRFRHIEERVKQSGKSFKDFTLDELDAFWDEAKRIEKQGY
ncbi:tetrapyrrole methylase family protein/MazG family protein [Bacillus oleivorans]|uniref:Tetrapyrrole methylase family protein/MazG family protein n=1 Tax=Bacillus oleivorans TaxID=1448271 RepID=A0A285D8V2_9BACI|nr:nucleoside triphosphate pyrophosphohydrolase [Bacillus oleivorans]SNX75698.1 tetrapyrrole methylase family protein/MazG family protein [Bacillus oleivorans]